MSDQNGNGQTPGLAKPGRRQKIEELSALIQARQRGIKVEPQGFGSRNQRGTDSLNQVERDQGKTPPVRKARQNMERGQ